MNEVRATAPGAAAGGVPAAPRWEALPACAGVEPRVFFPEDDDGNPVEDGPQGKSARRICASCPVRIQCLTYALGVAMPAGIWGGHSTRERDAILGVHDR